ncbi:MMPL family transporter [Schlesneria paludicola]|uniref:MMPL family transporter n=1 Tax=Schlesneria paludicola TaxID=360056 RepID=UPI0002F9B359|nr:MMPL family transporter [Schlesneria paludicola]
MMFAKLGEFIVRAWPAVLIAWVVAVISASIAAPSLELVAETEEFAFLPPDSPSLQAESLFRKAFPTGFCPSRIVIVARRDSEKGITEEDRNFIDDRVDEESHPFEHPNRKFELREQLLRIAKEDEELAAESGRRVISKIRTFRDLAGGSLLESHDKKAILTLVELTTEFMDSRNRIPVGKVEELLSDPEFLKEKPEGLSIYLSGEATVGRDMLDAARNSAKATEWLTVVLVLILLGAIYRAPLMAIIPLVTVVVAVKFSMSLLILFALRGWVVLFQGIETYVAVLMYGAGVDYCLFLIARYKEEIDAGVSYDEAVSNCISKVGAAIAASAGTVICGIGMMIFANFGKFHEAGIAISFGLTIVLIASLTFTPALLRLAGMWAFWPQVRTERVSSGGWISSSSLLSRLSEIHLIQNTWEIVGRALIQMPMRIWLASIALMMPFAVIGVVFYTHLSYGLLSDLSYHSPSVRGTRVVQEHFPAGATGSITVLLQNENVDFSDRETGFAYIDELTQSLYDRKDELQLAIIRSVAFPIDRRWEDEPAGLNKAGTLKRSKQFYVSDEYLPNHVTRMEITAEVDPFARDSMNHLTRLENEIARLMPAGLKDGTKIFVSGSAASIRDLKAVTDGDQVRIDLLVVVGVFVILVLLLRKVALCTYLILTVLFSYLVALGVTYSFFSLTDPQFAGLDWKVPMFLFTILIAVGEDYNIFLMTRIEEEQVEHGPVKGVVEALSKTGRIISSCGIIMAGTFASLCAGSLKGMIQLGFALAFGVLLDTFVVRPILVPAYLVLLHSGRFGRFGAWLGGPVPEPAATDSPAP